MIRGREFYEEFHEKEWDPQFESRPKPSAVWYCPMCEEVLQERDVSSTGRCVDCGSEVEEKEEEVE